MLAVVAVVMVAVVTTMTTLAATIPFGVTTAPHIYIMLQFAENFHVQRKYVTSFTHPYSEDRELVG